MSRRRDPYPPIGDYALLGDCYSAALVSRDGSIDWCCMPRFDEGSAFGRLLDWEKGGYFAISPRDDFESSRAYIDDTLVLETTFRTGGGEARLFDCFTMHEGGAKRPWHQLLRIVEGVRGRMTLRVALAARFDYGEVKAWLRRHDLRLYSAVGGNDALMISGDFEFAVEREHDLVAEVAVRAGERVRLSVVAVRPEDIDPDVPPAPDAEELDRRLEQTVAWWHRWGSKLRLAGPHEPAAKRSAIVLKALVHAPTGAFVAAPTTSLPERIGGDCNWDYRFSWIRDSVFSARALVQLGCHEEADGFRRFVERSAAGNAESLRIAYGVGGERRLAELELTHLEGYRRSAPVRAGNAASVQEQFDVYGELLELAWRWHGLGHSPDDDYWRFLLSLVEAAAERWKDPDRGIWETREKPRHFVHSKVMCWVALDRGIRLSEECLRRAPVRRWRAVRDELRDAIETRGWSKRKQSFVQAFDTTEVDAALLLLPSVDFVAYDDERMIKTTDAVRDELCVDGLVRRYQDDDDAFLPCSFWLAECLARQGRVDEARATFDRAVAAANDLGLFSEQYAARSRELLGNFPQGLSHLSHILAAVALTEATPPGLETDIAG